MFPNIGRVVFPEVGSILFWLNTHDDGRLNEFSLHGVCPVLFGIRTSKYQCMTILVLMSYIFIYIYIYIYNKSNFLISAAIKWTLYNQQLFKKPCKKRKSSDYD